jgi:predicted component of type VI protein secretion system
MDVNLSLVSQMPKANRNVRQEADENGTTVMGAGIMVSPQHFPATGRVCGLVCRRYRPDGLIQPWGVINVAFEPETLKLGRLQARHLHIRFPGRHAD